MAQEVSIWLHDSPGNPTARHRYVAHVVFEVILGWEVSWPGLEQEWLSASGPRVQYGGDMDGIVPVNTARIPSGGWLESRRSLDDRGLWVEDEQLASRIPFGIAMGPQIMADWWSWIFWMTTRFEEMQAPADSRDAMGRFLGKYSMGHKENWLNRPEIEVRVLNWAHQHGWQAKESTYRVIPTIDVDSAFAYRHRSPLHTMAAATNDFIRGRWDRWGERWSVLMGKKNDPYDTYDWLENLHRKHGLRTTYFFLLANRSEFDRGLPWRSKGLKSLIRGLDADIGIHPGCASHQSSSIHLLQLEKSRLESILGSPVALARQHYLLQRPDASWLRLEEAGIAHDHSLGFSDVPGFRAGMSRAFRAYSLSEERMLNLWLHPVAAMDATFLRYLETTPEAAVQIIEKLALEVKAVQGTLRLLWHNESVSDRWEWHGWKVMYEQVLSRVC